LTEVQAAVRAEEVTEAVAAWERMVPVVVEATAALEDEEEKYGSREALSLLTTLTFAVALEAGAVTVVTVGCLRRLSNIVPIL
jgi:hypothetical protein